MDYLSPAKENLQAKVNNCAWCMCFTVENGMVGRCARSIPALTIQRIQMRPQDYLWLNENLTITDVSRYFMFIIPMECCKHCKGTNGEPITAAIQIGEENT